MLWAKAKCPYHYLNDVMVKTLGNQNSTLLLLTVPDNPAS